MRFFKKKVTPIEVAPGLFRFWHRATLSEITALSRRQGQSSNSPEKMACEIEWLFLAATEFVLGQILKSKEIFDEVISQFYLLVAIHMGEMQDECSDAHDVLECRTRCYQEMLEEFDVSTCIDILELVKNQESPNLSAIDRVVLEDYMDSVENFQENYRPRLAEYVRAIGDSPSNSSEAAGNTFARLSESVDLDCVVYGAIQFSTYCGSLPGLFRDLRVISADRR